MAEGSNTSNTGDNNPVDLENEFEFDPMEWMVLDDDDDADVDVDENVDDESAKIVNNVSVCEEKPNPQKNAGGRTDTASNKKESVSTSETRTRSKSSTVTGSKNERSSNATTTRDEAKKVDGRKSGETSNAKRSNEGSGSRSSSASSSSQQQKSTGCKAGNKPGSEKSASIADVFEPSVQIKSQRLARSTTSARANTAATSDTSITAKLKAEAGLISTPQTTTPITGATPKRKADDKPISTPLATTLNTSATTKSKADDKSIGTAHSTASNTSVTTKRKADEKSICTPPTKVLKGAAGDQSKGSTTQTKGTGSVRSGGSDTNTPAKAKTPSSSVPKTSTSSQSTSQSGPKQQGVTHTTKTAASAQSRDKTPQALGARSNSTKTNESLASAGDSIAEAMGVKISSDHVASEKDLTVSAASAKKHGSKKTDDDESPASAKPNNKPLNSKSGTGSASTAVSVSSQNSDKDAMSGSANSGVSKKRIVRRFHRTTQTSVPPVSNKLLQCLIKIPSLDWPKKPPSCDIGLLTDQVLGTSEQDSASTSGTKSVSVTVKADSVTQDVFNQALSFGMAEEGSVPPKRPEDYGIRFCNILGTDTNKANANLKKADGYRLSFPSTDLGTLDLFYQAEEGLVQMYTYFRKNRLGPRHVCMSVVMPPTVPDKKDTTKEPMPGVSATIVFDQNYASTTYLSYAKAPMWKKPKADVFVSVHNVPKDVPLSLFHIIFPDAISIEMDDPTVKVTKQTSNRVKLGMPRKVVSNFNSLFAQVVVNNSLLVFSSGLTREEDVPEMKEIIASRKKEAEQSVEKCPTLTAVPRDINAQSKKTKTKSASDSELILMQVEDVECVEKVLTGRAGAWKGPATPDKLREKKTSSSKTQKSGARSSLASSSKLATAKDQLSDISDDSDIGGDDPGTRRHSTAAGRNASAMGAAKQVINDSPDVLNRWRQTKPLNAARMERHERDHPRREGGEERFVDARRQEHRNPQRPMPRHEDSRPHSGREIVEGGAAAGDRKFNYDGGFDARRKIIKAGPDKSGGGDGEEDLRCVLDSLKSRRPSKVDREPSVEYIGSTSPIDRRGGDGPVPPHRVANRPDRDRDRRVVSSRNSPPPGGPRRRSPSPFRPTHSHPNRAGRSSSPPPQRHHRSPLSSSGRQQPTRNRQQSPPARHSPPHSPQRSAPSRQQQQQEQQRPRRSRSGDRVRPAHNNKRSSSPRDRAWPPHKRGVSPGNVVRPQRKRSLSPKRPPPRRSLSPTRPPPRRSLSPRSRERTNNNRSLSPRSRELTSNNRSLSPSSRKRIRTRGRKRRQSPTERERLLKRSLSPILPFRPAQRNRNNNNNRESRESPQDSMRVRQSPHGSSASLKDRNSRVSRERSGSGSDDDDHEMAVNKSLYNSLMDRLREKANSYNRQSQQDNHDDERLTDVYGQINDLAQMLTAMKNDKEAVQRFGRDLDNQLEAAVQHTHHTDSSNKRMSGSSSSNSGHTSNNNNAVSAPASSSSGNINELHPDILRYVNVKPAGGGVGVGVPQAPGHKWRMMMQQQGSSTQPVAMSPRPPQAIPPPIPPPVAPPLFTGDSPTDKNKQLNAIAKQLVSDMKKHQGESGGGGGMGASGGRNNNNNDNKSNSSSSVSGGMWMIPPPTSASNSNAGMGGGGGGFPHPSPSHLSLPPTSMMNPVVGGPGGAPQLMPVPGRGPFSMPPPPVVPVPPNVNMNMNMNASMAAALMNGGMPPPRPPGQQHFPQQQWNPNNNNPNQNNAAGCRQS